MEKLEKHQCDVLVVGAGPVGLSTAMFLTLRGIRVSLVDKRNPLDAPPRASASVRTLELFRSVGSGEACEHLSWDGPAPLHSVVKDTAVGATTHRAAPPHRYRAWLESCSPVGIGRALTQSELQRVALAEIVHRGESVHFGVEATGITVGDSGVRVALADTTTGTESTIWCRYLVGADGAGSRVRQLMGIDMPRRQVAARLNTAFFRADLGRLLPESRTHTVFIRNESVYCTLFAKGAGGDRWSSHIMDYPGKPDALSRLPDARTIGLLHAAIGDDSVPIDLIECNAWEAAFAVADRFRRGPVFLAGDAAHTQSSAGGLGMNTGIQDGHNLAWKLAAVLRGEAAPALLDSYDPERRAAAEASLAAALRLHDGYQGQRDVNRMYEQIAADYLRAMIGYRYVLDEDEDEDEDATSHQDGLIDHATVGCRLPHRWLTSGDREVSTLDLLGPGWTLLVGPDGDRWRSAVTGQGGMIDIRQVPGAGTSPSVTAFLEMAGIRPDGALLVRPDQFVAWRAPEVPDAPGPALRVVIDRLAARRR